MNLEKEFESVVNQHKANLYMICYMYAKDKDETSDFFQETLIRLWQGFSQFRGESNINTWISRICINTCISGLRKKKKHSETIPLSIDMELLEETNENGKQLAQMYRLINKLGVLDKALILLWLDNMSYAEISEIMGISVSNVSVKLMRIKEKLKTMATVASNGLPV